MYRAFGEAVVAEAVAVWKSEGVRKCKREGNEAALSAQQAHQRSVPGLSVAQLQREQSVLGAAATRNREEQRKATTKEKEIIDCWVGGLKRGDPMRV